MSLGSRREQSSSNFVAVMVPASASRSMTTVVVVVLLGDKVQLEGDEVLVVDEDLSGRAQ